MYNDSTETPLLLRNNAMLQRGRATPVPPGGVTSSVPLYFPGAFAYDRSAILPAISGRILRSNGLCSRLLLSVQEFTPEMPECEREGRVCDR